MHERRIFIYKTYTYESSLNYPYYTLCMEFPGKCYFGKDILHVYEFV